MDDATLERARAQWNHRGTERPPFAVAPGPGQESVWDYPRPPRIEPDSRVIRVEYQGETIAETRNSVRILETASPPAFYIPPEDVRTEWLERARGASICEWKGSATYWSFVREHVSVPNVAWSYEKPFPEFASIRGYLSFYPSKLECYVGEHRVKPQPGDFYGGWVTPEVVGPFKGDPGTSGW